ncbi:MAG: hypothetical protein IJY71_02580 [Clostridia bacterium]|nr:hypothetical protein [Clostridia bacterium]
MKYIVDHDLHIHTCLSLCSGDPAQTPARIWQYAKERELSTVCLTDHYWDEAIPGASEWYQRSNFARIRESLSYMPPRGVNFLFGCETEMDKSLRLGISEKRLSYFDFIVIPTTHLHMEGFTIEAKDDAPARRAELYVKRFDALLSMDLPFEKIGIAHLTCPLIDVKRGHLGVLNLIPDGVFHELFARVAKKGAGVELNFNASAYVDEELESELRPYRIAKKEGCRFYFGSDAHHPDKFATAKANFIRIASLLGLREEEKFTVKAGEHSPFAL